MKRYKYRPSRAKPKTPKRPDCGPCATTEWDSAKRCWRISLTPEGESLFSGWLARFPGDLYAILRKHHFRSYVMADALARRDREAVQSAAMVGVWQGVALWKPERGSLATSVSLRMTKELRTLAREISRGVARAFSLDLDSLIDKKSDPVRDAEVRLATDEVKTAIARLPQVPAAAIRKVYGLDDGRPLSFSEAGLVLRTSKQNVQQIVSRGIRTLKTEFTV